MDDDNIGGYIVSQYNEDTQKHPQNRRIAGAFVESFREADCQLNSFNEENEEGAPLMSTEEDTCVCVVVEFLTGLVTG